MIDPKVLVDPKNNKINLWPERNPMIWNRIMLNVQTKQAIDFGYKQSQQDEDDDSRLTNYEACQINRASHICGKE